MRAVHPCPCCGALAEVSDTGEGARLVCDACLFEDWTPGRYDAVLDEEES